MDENMPTSPHKPLTADSLFFNKSPRDNNPVPLRSAPWTLYQDRYEQWKGRLNLVLKDRQTGMTTWGIARAFLTALNGGHSYSVVDDRVGAMSLVMSMYANLPNLAPVMQASRAAHSFIFEHGGSLHISQSMASARGKELDFIHIDDSHSRTPMATEIQSSVVVLTPKGELMVQAAAYGGTSNGFWQYWDPSNGFTKLMISRH